MPPSITYPFIPKSNAKLEAGHFWPIKLSDGKFGCGIVLEVPKDGPRAGTRNFYAGLLDWIGDSKPTPASLEGAHLRILDEGNVHIKTIVEHGQAIEGRISLREKQLEIEYRVDCQNYGEYSMVVKGYEVIRKSNPEDHKTMKTSSTWGYSVIIDKANFHLSKQK